MTMWRRMKAVLYRYVPAHVDNPFTLVKRMFASGNQAARFTLFSSALALLCLPMDIVMSWFEKRRIGKAPALPSKPMIFVCGPARSGTTLVYQVLAHHLPLNYLQNFTTLFPRSPIVATRIWRRFSRMGRYPDSFENYYGKTSGMFAPSEANHIWNRWVEPDATGFRTQLSEQSATECRHFFSAFGSIDDRPLLCKNNNMNVYAETIAEIIPDSIFICLKRNPAFLAQSLLQARREIRGSVSRVYGVQQVASDIKEDHHPIRSVCLQIRFLDDRAVIARDRIGKDRFWIVDYEEFCKHPEALVNRVCQRLGLSRDDVDGRPEPLENRNTVTDPVQMEQIRRRLAEQLD